MTMKPLELFGIPLEGTHLIEASAGTGKTYTIASLYIRLLLEKSLHVREILVVTYTVPATDELKTRIREKIRAALGAFESGRSDDPFLAELLSRHSRHDHAIQALEFALRRFDEAAIFTIHGFCRRVLSEMAFESRSLFEHELITDQADLLKAVVGDFYRLHFYDGMPPELVHYAANAKYTFGFFLTLFRKASLDVTVIPEIEKAIAKSNLGITPFNDGKLIRLQIPQLTQERREELKKVVKTMAEEGRISLRTIRRDANDAIKKLETDKIIPEDERFRSQDEVQKLTDKCMADLENILKDKEKELTEV